MVLPQWEKRFSINHTQMDAQHQELFHLAGKVLKINPRTSTKQEVRILFGEFFHYMGEHFKEEEAYMQSIEYPGLAEHKALHESIIEEITKILKTQHTIVGLKGAMLEATRHWLVDHIMQHDKKIQMWQKSYSLQKRREEMDEKEQKYSPYDEEMMD